MKRLTTFLIGLLLTAAALAFELRLTAEERAACDAGGGCRVITEAWLRDAIGQTAKQAVDAGFEAGRKHAAQQCGSPT